MASANNKAKKLNFGGGLPRITKLTIFLSFVSIGFSLVWLDYIVTHFSGVIPDASFRMFFLRVFIFLPFGVLFWVFLFLDTI